MYDGVMKPKRRYRKIDEATIAKFLATKAVEGNGSAAVRTLEPDAKDPGRRAVLIAEKSKELTGAPYIEREFSELAVAAVDRIKELVESTDEHVASKNAHFVVDHVRGKAIQRSENKNVNLNIQSVLD